MQRRYACRPLPRASSKDVFGSLSDTYTLQSWCREMGPGGHFTFSHTGGAPACMHACAVTARTATNTHFQSAWFPRSAWLSMLAHSFEAA